MNPAARIRIASGQAVLALPPSIATADHSAFARSHKRRRGTPSELGTESLAAGAPQDGSLSPGSASEALAAGRTGESGSFICFPSTSSAEMPCGAKVLDPPSAWRDVSHAAPFLVIRSAASSPPVPQSGQRRGNSAHAAGAIPVLGDLDRPVAPAASPASPIDVLHFAHAARERRPGFAQRPPRGWRPIPAGAGRHVASLFVHYGHCGFHGDCVGAVIDGTRPAAPRNPRAAAYVRVPKGLA